MLFSIDYFKSCKNIRGRNNAICYTYSGVVVQTPGGRVMHLERFWDSLGLGTADGSHIPIKTPRENPNAYYNRKRIHTVVPLAAFAAK